jgi:hypothetical protein
MRTSITRLMVTPDQHGKAAGYSGQHDKAANYSGKE